ncbi:hypothetical protein TWF173_003565 [Orbilia oligospora]|nr:hypothetical protein TWF173_003565 [Orbilia oligospora]
MPRRRCSIMIQTLWGLSNSPHPNSIHWSLDLQRISCRATDMATRVSSQRRNSDVYSPNIGLQQVVGSLHRDTTQGLAAVQVSWLRAWRDSDNSPGLCFFMRNGKLFNFMRNTQWGLEKFSCGASRKSATASNLERQFT